jgi:hypothetical protein
VDVEYLSEEEIKEREAIGKLKLLPLGWFEKVCTIFSPLFFCCCVLTFKSVFYCLMGYLISYIHLGVY